MAIIYNKLNFHLLNETQIKMKLSLLPWPFNDKISKYSSLLKKQQRIEGLELLEKVFIENNLCLDDIKYNKNGKPFVNDKIDFSLTYSKNNAVLSLIKKGSIGIDLEKVITINLLDFKDYFTDTELSIITNSNNIDSIFCKLWTRKEAVSKAFLDFQSFEVLENVIYVNNKKIKISSELISEKYWLSKAVSTI